MKGNESQFDQLFQNLEFLMGKNRLTRGNFRRAPYMRNQPYAHPRS